MKVTFTLLLVAIFFVVKPLLVDAQKVYTSDSLALVDLYNSTDGSNWLNHSGWLIRAP